MPDYITVYTDASYCPNIQQGGWATWIKCNSGTYTYSGILERPTCCTSAEMMAIANALYFVFNRHYEPCSKIVVVTDSEASKKAIERKVAKNITIKAALDYIFAALPDDCELRVNKVKAHCSNDGKRSYVNHMVDRMAFEQMKQAMRLKSASANI